MSESEEPRKLWPRDHSEEHYIPGVPRFFWLDARMSYEAEIYVGAILLAALAAESGLREYLKVYILRRFGKDAVEFIDAHLLEEMDFRRLVMMCERLGLLKSIITDLHKIYNVRTKYAHVKIMPILGELAEEDVTVHESDTSGKIVDHYKVKDDDFLTSAIVFGKAEEHSWGVLEKTYNVLKVIFMQSGYWRGQEGQP